MKKRASGSRKYVKGRWEDYWAMRTVQRELNMKRRRREDKFDFVMMGIARRLRNHKLKPGVVVRIIQG